MLDVTRADPVRVLSPARWEESLTMPVGKMLERPLLFLQTVLDHTHSSYSHDLAAIARLRAAAEAAPSLPQHRAVGGTALDGGDGEAAPALDRAPVAAGRS